MTGIPQTSERPLGAGPRVGCKAGLPSTVWWPSSAVKTGWNPAVAQHRGGRSPPALITVKGRMAGCSGADPRGLWLLTGSGPLLRWLSAGSSLGQLGLRKRPLVKLPEPLGAASLSPQEATACKSRQGRKPRQSLSSFALVLGTRTYGGVK